MVFAIAEALGRSGAAVVLNGRDKEALDTAVSEFVEQGSGQRDMWPT